MQGMSDLASYLAENRISTRQFAADLGVNQSSIWRIVNRKNLPTFALAARIERATGGAVPVSVWARGAPASQGDGEGRVRAQAAPAEPQAEPVGVAQPAGDGGLQDAQGCRVLPRGGVSVDRSP